MGMARPDAPVCARVLLKPGSLPQVREWAAHIAAHRDAALQTLRAEGVSIESVFLDSRPDGDWLVYYMRADSVARAQQVAQDSVAEIDRYHQAFKRATWDRVERLELLVDLQGPGVTPPASAR